MKFEVGERVQIIAWFVPARVDLPLTLGMLGTIKGRAGSGGGCGPYQVVIDDPGWMPAIATEGLRGESAKDSAWHFRACDLISLASDCTCVRGAPQRDCPSHDTPEVLAEDLERAKTGTREIEEELVAGSNERGQFLVDEYRKRAREEYSPTERQP